MFKVGDKVRVIDATRSGGPTSGETVGRIEKICGALCWPNEVIFSNGEMCVYDDDEVEYVKESQVLTNTPTKFECFWGSGHVELYQIGQYTHLGVYDTNGKPLKSFALITETRKALAEALLRANDE